MIKNQNIWKEDKILSSPAAKNSLKNSNPILKCNIKTFISKINFEEKPIGYPDFNFHEVNLSILEYVDKIVNGYAFCNLFRCPNGKYLEKYEKNEENYIGSNVIVFDIDNCEYTKEYIQQKLKHKPTIIYSTFTHGTYVKDKLTGKVRKANKMRLIYYTDSITYGKENYEKLYDAIKQLIENDIKGIKLDNHLRTPVQFYYGTKHKDVIINNIIYSPINIENLRVDISEELDKNVKICINEDNEEGKSGITYHKIYYKQQLSHYQNNNINITILPANDTINHSLNNNSEISQYLDKNLKQYLHLFKDTYFWNYYFGNVDQKTDTNNKLYLNINDTYSINSFILHFKNQYLILMNNKYQFTFQNGHAKKKNYKFIRIMRNGKTPVKYRDGERRRNRLYIIGLQIKDIKPDISLEQMMITLLHIYDMIIVNNGNKITKRILLQKAIEALTQPNYTGYVNIQNHGNLIDMDWCDENNIKPNVFKQKLRKAENDTKIGELFDWNLNYEENHKFLNEQGVKCSLRRVKKFVMDNFPEEYEKRKKKAGRKPKAQN